MRIALILTGGPGTRLAPITKTLNKGLVPIDGQPVLERIILQLENSNVDKIIVLAGYLSWQVEDLLKIRSKLLKSDVVVSITAPELSPADRLLETSKIWMDASDVVLIYCDNLFEDIEITKYLVESETQKVLVNRRMPGNISIQSSGQVNYSVKRSEEFPFVELGYWILKPLKLLNFLIEQNDLQKALQELTAVELVYYQEISKYRTLSDLSRYGQERAKNRKTIFLDRDGVLIAGIGKGEYVKNVSQIRFLRENIEFFSFLSTKYQVDFIIVTNQAGVEQNLVTIEEVNEINRYIAIKLLGVGVPILAFYICPHHWDSRCECRKPKPGLLNSAISDFVLDPVKCIMIGDRESDINAGINANIRSFLFPEKMSIRNRADTHQDILNFIKTLEAIDVG